MAELSLSKGYVAIVDAADLPILNKFSWSVSEAPRRKPYAVASMGYGRKGRKNVYLHRFLLEAQPGQMVDHINGNSLDNRRENLRLATGTQNNYNQFKRKNSKSDYRGVSFDPNYADKPWVARGMIAGKCVHRSWHKTEKEAARAYNSWARTIADSKFVRLNEV